MARLGKEAVSELVLLLADWFIHLIHLDLYNKSRMTGDCQVRFCERLGVKFPLAYSIKWLLCTKL